MSGLFNILASFLIMPSIIHHKYVLNSLLIVGPIGDRPIPGIFLLLLLWPVSDFHSQSLIYHIQASGTHQPIHFLKAHDVSYPHSEGNTNTKKKTFTKIMIGQRRQVNNCVHILDRALQTIHMVKINFRQTYVHVNTSSYCDHI